MTYIDKEGLDFTEIKNEKNQFMEIAAIVVFTVMTVMTLILLVAHAIIGVRLTGDAKKFIIENKESMPDAKLLFPEKPKDQVRYE